MTRREIIPISSKARPISERRKISFKRDVTEANGVREVTELSMYVLNEDATPIEIFQMIREFDEATVSLKWTSGPKLFDNFKILVSGSIIASTEWQLQVDQITTKTTATFASARNEFLKEMLKPLNYAKQLDYLRSLKKPFNMDLLEYKREFMLANVLASKFPDANGASGLDADEFKRCFFKAMPNKWVDAFIQAGKDEDESSFNDIYKHMNKMEILDERQATKSNGGRGNGNNGSSSNGN